MKFSFETPIKYLYELDDSQDYLFILAHHLTNKKYFEYCKYSNKYKILDNGAYELGESIAPKKLKLLAQAINADVIVIPDKLFDKKRSMQLEREFFSLFNKKERKQFKFMKVTCANNFEEYVGNLYGNTLYKGYDIIGISRSRTVIAPNLSYLINILKVVKNKKPIHILGLTHPFELLECQDYDKIKTIDTGMPINFAFKNKLMTKVKKASDFQRISGEDLDTKKKLNIRIAKENIKRLKYFYG